MSELNDSSDLQNYSLAVLYVLSAVNTTPEFVDIILERFVSAIKSSTASTPFLLYNPYSRIRLVVAHTLACIASPCCFLLSESCCHHPSWGVQGYGRASWLSGGPKCRSSRNGFSDSFWCCQMLAAAEHYFLEGTCPIFCRKIPYLTWSHRTGLSLSHAESSYPQERISPMLKSYVLCTPLFLGSVRLLNVSHTLLNHGCHRWPKVKRSAFVTSHF